MGGLVGIVIYAACPDLTPQTKEITGLSIEALMERDMCSRRSVRMD